MKCNYIISANNNSLGLNDFTNQIIIDADLIEGNKSGDAGVVFAFKGSNFVLKNATIINKNTGNTTKGIGLFNDGAGHFPTPTLQNVKIISEGSIIYYNSTPAINIDNYVTFGNKDIESYINFLIGTEANYVFVHSPDLT